MEDGGAPARAAPFGYPRDDEHRSHSGFGGARYSHRVAAESAGGVHPVAARGTAVSLKNGSLAAPAAPLAAGARQALAAAEPAAHGRTDRIPADGIGVRIDGRSLRAG